MTDAGIRVCGSYAKDGASGCWFQDLAKLAEGRMESAKLRKAQELVAKGLAMEIVSESDFVKLLADR